MESMTKIFPVTVTKLNDPVTIAIKNISKALYGLPVPTPLSAAEQDVESLVDMLQDVLENRSVVWLSNEPKRREKQEDRLREICTVLL